MNASFPRSLLRRRLRRLLRSAMAAPGRHGFVDLDDMVGGLCQWAASIPWARELTGPPDAPLERAFAIDCPPLSCSGPWFVVRTCGDDLDDGPELLAVLPNRLADRGVALGWAAEALGIDDGLSLARIALPTTGPELNALQRLLMVAYSTAFRGTSNR